MTTVQIKNFHYQLKNLEELSPTITRLLLVSEANESMKFQAGQYLEILYPDKSYQPFSIANAPQANGALELHIRHLPDDKVTLALLAQIKLTRSITVRGPIGVAFYRATPNRPIILLAGGTGFAYAKAIIEAAIQQQDARLIHLYWGVKIAADFYTGDLPEQWQKQLINFRYTPLISQPQASPSWQGKTGYVTNAVINDYPDLSEFQVYGSGPYAMIIAAATLFQQHGLAREFFYSDML